MPTFSAGRAACVLALLCVILMGLSGRVAYLETYGRQQTLRQVERQQHQTLIERARPGCIYDRDGLLLAGTVQTQTLFVDPKFMEDVYRQEGRSMVEMDEGIH